MRLTSAEKARPCLLKARLIPAMPEPHDTVSACIRKNGSPGGLRMAGGWETRARAVMMALGVTAKRRCNVRDMDEKLQSGRLDCARCRKRGSYLLLMLWVRSKRARNVGAAAAD